MIAAIFLIAACASVLLLLFYAEDPEPDVRLCPLCERIVQPPSSLWTLHPMSKNLR